jgi:hypothetical protein
MSQNDTSAPLERSGGTSGRRLAERTTLSGLQIPLPVDVVELIVDQVADRLRDELGQRSPWMTRQQAADHLRVPVSRLEKDRTVPAHRWDGRVMYHRGELDSWLQAA